MTKNSTLYLKNYISKASTVLLLGFIFILLPKASAQSQSPKGVTISPAYQQVSISAGEQKHTIQFKITNNETKPIVIDLSTTDFNALEESGGLFFVGTNPTELQKKYGLAKWLSLAQSSLKLSAKQSITLQADILNQESLAPGGHYGAINLALAGNNSKNQSGTNKVAIHPIASLLLFVTKLGGDTHYLSLSSVNYSHNIFSLPSSLSLRFQNIGNTHLIPRGTVTINDSSGKIVKRGVINQESFILLPQNYRRYDVPLETINSSVKMGKYKLIVNFRIDGSDQVRSYRASFFFLSKIIIGLILLGMAFVAAAGIAFINKSSRQKVKKILQSFHTR